MQTKGCYSNFKLINFISNLIAKIKIIVTDTSFLTIYENSSRYNSSFYNSYNTFLD